MAQKSNDKKKPAKKMERDPFKVNQPVTWMWLGKPIHGKVCEIHLSPVTKEIKGKKIKRNGSAENPAYLVQSEAGNYALKLGSELKIKIQTAYKGPKPSLF